MGGRNKKRKDRGKDQRFSNSNFNKRVMSLTTKFTIGTVISVAIIFVAYLYSQIKVNSTSEELEQILNALLQEERSVIIDPSTKVAVGFGSCLDVIVQSNQVIFDSAPQVPEHFYSISTKQEFLKVFAYFYQYGAAAERYISNASLFNELVDNARKASSARYHIGGNAPVMAKRFVKEGYEVLLGAQMSKTLEKQFPDRITISGPYIEDDDIHLLLEYPAGQRWGHFTPPRANRFIVHNDHQNPKLSSFSAFSNKVESYRPNLLVIGGLQMMDNFPMSEESQQEQLLKVKKLMESQPETMRIHFEMASYSDEKLLKNLVENVIPFADSLGMNEQELPNLYQMMKYGNVSLVAESRPRIAVILDEMRDVFELLQEIVGGRKLTRLHVHTLAFQAIMVDKSSAWKNTKPAAAKAALVANRHICGSDIIDITKAKILMDEAFTTTMKSSSRRIPFERNKPISCWDEKNIEVCIAPVLVCTEVVQTGGGGDNISSAALVLQI